jgi:hypothetical protein
MKSVVVSASRWPYSRSTLKKQSSSKTRSRAKPAASARRPPKVPTYQLKITLDLVKPPIWRRLSVPGDATLGWLHAVIQVAMGWTNSHLHQFSAGDRIFSDPSFDPPPFDDGPETLDEEKFSIQEVAPAEKDVLRYEYDFGDGWLHTIVVEKILPPETAPGAAARCLAGQRACPPDDCGGPWGYQNLLAILRNPKHEEHESMMDWIGGRFDSEAFDLPGTNAHLRMLKWPRASVEHLRRVLMKRDGFVEP